MLTRQHIKQCLWPNNLHTLWDKPAKIALVLIWADAKSKPTLNTEGPVHPHGGQFSTINTTCLASQQQPGGGEGTSCPGAPGGLKQDPGAPVWLNGPLCTCPAQQDSLGERFNIVLMATLCLGMWLCFKSLKGNWSQEASQAQSTGVKKNTTTIRHAAVLGSISGPVCLIWIN